MIKFILKLPIFKRLIPSLGIRISKLFNKNKGYYNIKNIFFYLDFLDPVDRQIILNKEYEQDAVNFLEDEMEKNFFSNFLDIGANSGYYSFYFAKKFSNLKIQSFEPNIDAYNKFLKTISKNSFKNVEISNLGLSNINNKVKMITWFKHGIAKTNSIILDKSHDIKNSKIFEANLRIGDEIIKISDKKIVLKIDVEGHELCVLDGLKSLLNKNKSLILIEIADEKFEKVNKYLSEKNFRIIFKSKYRLDYVYSNL
ncbi:FkbM family methyltransferase [Candidatus Pelagibacter sp.]|nr:FkbM family methyltransferase [Candidatus Pelagibacter sp.]